jgi:hypothetical protein
MTVYVDQLAEHGWKLRGHTVKSCHMIADNEAELHQLAYAIGMKRTWFQAPPKASFPHYDLTESRRERAVQLGAQSLDRSEFVAVMRRLRETQKELSNG